VFHGRGPSCGIELRNIGRASAVAGVALDVVDVLMACDRNEAFAGVFGGWGAAAAGAALGRYLNVVRTVGRDGGPAGNPTDFPIWCDLADEQILEAFVAAVCSMTGCALPGE
jgi:hypothetical protein